MREGPKIKVEPNCSKEKSISGEMIARERVESSVLYSSCSSKNSNTKVMCIATEGIGGIGSYRPMKRC